MKIIFEVGDRVLIKKTLDPKEARHNGHIGIVSRIRHYQVSGDPTTCYYVRTENRQTQGIKCLLISPLFELPITNSL